MARQKGILPIEGTIGNVTFFKTKDGYMAKQKGGVDGNRIATSPAFERTRENNAEFGRAGKAGKIFREAFRLLILVASDNRIVARLTGAFLKVIKADATSTRGKRNVLDGELELLQGFEGNIQSRLGSSLFAPYTATIDRVTGECLVTIPPFVPAQMLASPPGASHFKITVAGAAIDFEEATMETGFAKSNDLPITIAATAAVSLKVTLEPNSTKPLFIGIALEYFQQVNGTMYSLKNGSFNSMAIVKVLGL